MLYTIFGRNVFSIIFDSSKGEDDIEMYGFYKDKYIKLTYAAGIFGKDENIIRMKEDYGDLEAVIMIAKNEYGYKSYAGFANMKHLAYGNYTGYWILWMIKFAPWDKYLKMLEDK